MSPDFHAKNIGSVKLLQETGWSAWAYNTGFGFGGLQRVGWHTVSVSIAVIYYNHDTSEHVVALRQELPPFSLRKDWDRIIAYARSYPWAEQGGDAAKGSFNGPFVNWPKSMYKAWHTNSNTFVGNTLKAANINFAWGNPYISGNHPGSTVPTQNWEAFDKFYAQYPPWKGGAAPPMPPGVPPDAPDQHAHPPAPPPSVPLDGPLPHFGPYPDEDYA